MKTVTVSEIIRTAQMGDTRYVLLTEAEADIAEQTKRAEDYLDEMRSAQQKWIERGAEIAALEHDCEFANGKMSEYAAQIDSLRERERVLVEVIDKVLDKVKENEHFFKYFRGDIRVKDLVQSLFELEAVKDGGCGVSSVDILKIAEE